MASVKVNFSALDELAKKIKELGDIHGSAAAKEILAAGAEVAVEEWKVEIHRQGYIDTGAMLNNVRAYVGKTRARIYPSGDVVRNGKETSNATKAYFLNVGRKNMIGSRYVANIEREVAEKAPAKMQAAFENYLKKRGLI